MHLIMMIHPQNGVSSIRLLFPLIMILLLSSRSIFVTAQGGEGEGNEFSDSNDDTNHAHQRIIEQVDAFMYQPVVGLSMFNDFYTLGGFPNNLNAQDQDVAIKFMYSMFHTGIPLGAFTPFYGLENGLFLGYFHSDRVNATTIPNLVYREPGQDGYNQFVGDYNQLIYLQTCVDGITGETKDCQMIPGQDYVSCSNKDCNALIECGTSSGEQQSSSDDEPNNNDIIWCKNYTVEKAQDNDQLGFIPLSSYCIDSNGFMSQTPGEIQISSSSVKGMPLSSQQKTTLEDIQIGVAHSSIGIHNQNVAFGNCTYEDGGLVERTVWGPFASCGGDGIFCDDTYKGAHTSRHYDPRFRPWYTASRETQKPRWSDPYIFDVTSQQQDRLGITYTRPFYTTDAEGNDDITIFAGVMGIDLLLEDISNFVVTAFRGSENLVAIYETKGTHQMIAASTGVEIVENVRIANESELCTGDNVPEECELKRITVHNLTGSDQNEILRKAHDELEKNNFDVNNTANGYFHVREEDDDVTSTTHLVDFLVYEQEGANLEWGIIVTTPVQREEGDSITNEENIYYVIISLATLGFAICSALVILFFRKRNERAIKLADFKFTSAFIAGCALLNLCSLTFLEEATDSLCMLRMWSYYLVASMALSPVLIKALRTYKLLGNSTTIGRTDMSNFQAWLRTVPIVLVQLAILLSFTFLNPPVATENITFTGPEPTKSVLCTYENNEDIFFYIQLAFYGTLVVFGCIIAFLSRNIDKRFADARPLFFTMYNIAFTGIMFSVISFAVTVTETGISMMVSIGVFWVTVFSSAVFVLPRVAAVKKERLRHEQSRTRLRAIHTERNNPRFSSLNHTDLMHDSVDGTLKVLVCSANMGNAEPTLSSMKSWIPEDGNTDEIMTLSGEPIEAECFDVIAIGMQESTWSGTMKMNQDNNSDDNFGIDSTMETAPDDKEHNILAALEGTDTVTLRKMQKNILGKHYRLLKEEIRGQMRMYVWALEELFPYVEQVYVSGANTGIGNVLANKGGIVVSFKYKETKFSFLSAHLAAHEGDSYYQARCENVYDILRTAKTCKLSQRFDLSLSNNHMFVFGDLNFRTRFGDDTGLDERSIHTKTKSSDDSLVKTSMRSTKSKIAGENVDKALELIKQKDFDTLYGFDELYQGIDKGDLLVGFETLPCRFPPTFKVERQKGFVYKRQRTPSYTDRILYKSSAGLERMVRPLSYEACVDFVTSDHKPIRGAFSVAPNSLIDHLYLDCRFRLVFSEMECSDLPAADVSGSSDPFLKFVWTSIDMVEEKKRGIRMRRLRRFLTKKSAWPETNHISKTLNPKWVGKKMVLVSTGHEIAPEAVLYVSAYDYDFGASDDILGTVPLNIREIVTMGPDQCSKEIIVDEPLQAYGKYAGRIRFKIQVSLFIG